MDTIVKKEEDISSEIIQAVSGEVTFLASLSEDIFDPRRVMARSYLESGKIPENMIEKHPGKGGQIFSYVSHVYATLLMNVAFSNLWSWEIQHEAYYPDHSANVRGKLTVKFPYHDDEGKVYFVERYVMDEGAFDDLTDKMPQAMVITAAASRALVKCLFRMFGFGKELYKKEATMTAKDAIESIKRACVKAEIKFNEQWLPEAKARGLSSDNVVERYNEAYLLVAEVRQKIMAEYAKKQMNEE